MTNVPLHEVVRPDRHRDEAGKVGESLHALADWLKKNAADFEVFCDIDSKSLKSFVFDCKPPIAEHNHWSALLCIARNARK